MTKGEQARWLSILVPMLCGGLLGFILTAVTPAWRSFTHGAGPHLTPAEHLEAIAAESDRDTAKEGRKPSAPNAVISLLGGLAIAGLVLALVLAASEVQR
jgi:hypothetical protein